MTELSNDYYTDTPEFISGITIAVPNLTIREEKMTLEESLQNSPLDDVLKIKADAEHMIDACNAELERRKGEEIMRIRAMIAAEAAKIGATLEDVVAADPNKLKPKAPSKPKYRNPSNHEQTWTGRGKKPGWMIDQLGRGLKMEDMEIRD